jgi:hypothetical protein
MQAQIVTFLIGDKQKSKKARILAKSRQMSKFSCPLHQMEDKNFGISFAFWQAKEELLKREGKLFNQIKK